MDPNPSPSSSGCCCCFFIPRWERIRTFDTDQTRPEPESKWWRSAIEALKKAREWSDIVVGPRWKTFIRRFNRKGSGSGSGKQFGYDLLSYSLNFDGGSGHNDEDEYFGYSNQFVAAPGSNKGSMNLDADVVFTPPLLVAAAVRSENFKCICIKRSPCV